MKISLTVQILTPLINSCDIRKFESCIAKFKLSLTTNLSIVANFRWIIWIDWPFARRTVRYVYLLQGIWIIWISRPFAKKTVNYCNLLQMTLIIWTRRPVAKRTGSHGALLQMIWIVRMRRQYKKKQKAQSSDKDLCNLTVFNCVYILSV